MDSLMSSQQCYATDHWARIDKSTCGNWRCYPLDSIQCLCYATGSAQPNTHHTVYHCIAIDVTALGGVGGFLGSSLEGENNNVGG